MKAWLCRQAPETMNTHFCGSSTGIEMIASGPAASKNLTVAREGVALPSDRLQESAYAILTKAAAPAALVSEPPKAPQPVTAGEDDLAEAPVALAASE